MPRIALIEDGVVINVVSAGEDWQEHFPDGVASDTARIGDHHEGGGFETPLNAPPAPVVRDVIAERDRRLALGFDYDFGDARGVHQIGTTPADMTGWDEVTKVAQAMIATSAATATIEIITNTGPATVTASEWMAILLAAGAHRQPIWQASFVLQAMSPVPADYAADSRWA